MEIIAMIPARLGSQRLKTKNLQLINGLSLIQHAIKKTKLCDLFDSIWVNSESDVIKKIAENESVNFYKRPKVLSDNNSTSEAYIYDFLINHECDYLVQLHTIAPLLSVKEINSFTQYLISNKPEILFSYESIILECVVGNSPINFTFNNKTNSQNIKELKKISWAISAWKRDKYIKSYELGKCATYNGDIDYFQLSKISNHVIKNRNDLDIARSLFSMLNEKYENS